MTHRLRIRLCARRLRNAEDTPFRAIATGRVPRLGTLLSSVALHLVVIVVIAAISRQMPLFFKDDEIDWSRYRVELLRLQLAEPLYFRASAPEGSEASRSPRKAGEPAKRNAGMWVANSSVPRGMELPKPSAIAKNAPAIVQPDLHRETAPVPNALPPLAFWARQAADLPKPPSPKQLVAPGRTEEPGPASKLAATPFAAVPNREKAVADVNISFPSAAAHEQPALAMANSATVPVRLRRTGETHTASIDTFSGQPANVLALGMERIRHVEIPRGLQNLPGSREDGPAGAAAGKDESDSRGPYASASRSLGAGPAPAAADATGSAVPQVSTEGEAAPAAAKTTRIEHSANGIFDIVVTQSLPEDLADAEGLLTGSPVYTVYLPVGDRKEWLLEYCAPAGERPQSNSYQVFVGDATPLTPPYPISTIIPNSILAQPIPKQIVLHGLLTASGHLRNVQAAGPGHLAAAQILPLLNEWQFRPALRNKRPIDIEILLVIPARS